MHICIMSRTITEFCDTKELRLSNPSLFFFFFLSFSNNFLKYVCLWECTLEIKHRKQDPYLRVAALFSQNNERIKDRRRQKLENGVVSVWGWGWGGGLENKNKQIRKDFMCIWRVSGSVSTKTQETTFTANGICYTSFNENIQYLELFWAESERCTRAF